MVLYCRRLLVASFMKWMCACACAAESVWVYVLAKKPFLAKHLRLRFVSPTVFNFFVLVVVAVAFAVVLLLALIKFIAIFMKLFSLNFAFS